MRAKHTIEKVVALPEIGPLDLRNATEKALSELLALSYEGYNFTKPITITISIEGEAW